MLSKISSVSIWGIDGYPVTVEVDIGKGLPGISVVGLPDQAVKESRDRIKPSVRNSGFEFPNRKIVVNLAPADLKKEGSYFDLPIAVGILAASGTVRFPDLGRYFLVGELALDGTLRPIKGALSIALSLAEVGTAKLVLPAENAQEAAVVKSVEVYPVSTLAQTVELLQGRSSIPPEQVNEEELFRTGRQATVDFREVKGQRYPKRALEVAVSGGHNILLVGPPGAGKSMLASRIPTILPSLTLPEAVEITRIHSVAGLSRKGLVTRRPFRSPHHTISEIALVGGGSYPVPGEVSLAHNGVLFLDELPEFQRSALESMRQPLEDGHVSISRARGRHSFPSRFLLAAAMNPCPCGWYGDPNHPCHCTVAQILKYRKKISGPLLDRIDIHIDVESLPAGLMLKEREEEPSSAIRERVERAREVQKGRFAQDGIFFNAHMQSSHIRKYCTLSSDCRALLETAVEKMHFSARAFDKIRKVARTIADLEQSEDIQTYHISEAIQYRTLDRDAE